MPSNVIWLQQPLHVTFYMTTRCNLRCKHCYISDYTKEMSPDICLEVVDALAAIGVRKLSPSEENLWFSGPRDRRSLSRTARGKRRCNLRLRRGNT